MSQELHNGQLHLPLSIEPHMLLPPRATSRCADDKRARLGAKRSTLLYIHRIVKTGDETNGQHRESGVLPSAADPHLHYPDMPPVRNETLFSGTEGHVPKGIYRFLLCVDGSKAFHSLLPLTSLRKHGLNFLTELRLTI